MKCPDCGTRLSDIQVGGKLAQRCFKCGGFWADSDVVNSLSSGVLSTWRRISIDPKYFADGGGVCPLDGMKMERYIGESVPLSLNVKRCVRCGKWWFSGDTLHQYKPAQEAKFNYYRLWGITRNVTEVFLPLLVLFMIGMGLGVGLMLLRQRQQVDVPAAEGLPAGRQVREFVAVYAGGGVERISFVSTAPVGKIEYREGGVMRWNEVGVVPEGGRYTAQIDGLVEGQRYEVRILDETFKFESR